MNDHGRTGPGLSGADIGRKNQRALLAYLRGIREACARLPARNGKVNVTAVALACGFDRGVLYQNPRCKRLLQIAVKWYGLEGVGDRADAAPDTHDPRDDRIRKLEQQNAALLAENHSLRRKLARLQHIDNEMSETGRRVWR
ncbi:hypothetical protein GAY29_04095 [Azospirillum brasilense]|uniref:DUF6262 family protein n=1 Tax=Azospirillum brasilense TaxID=192 RepID=UPI00190CF00A|nr:DUF6262 family protein [Azospirillum brasilense]MBK3732292.1 hypothetical protein [Azospirillum brasilense]